MNDEIKEILDNIKEDINGKFEWEYIDGYYVEQIKPLLDYITNLQQEKDNLYLDNTMLKLEKDVYKQGYEELKEIIGNYVNVVLHDRKVIDNYKSRCEKAIELLKYCDPEPWSIYQITGGTLLNLLNILQNGSENNED